MVSNLQEPKKVLIVEDYPDDVRLIERAFSKLPVQIETMLVEDGAEAVRFSEVWDPLDEFFDLVLLDSRLPGATGIEMLKALREVDPMGRVPIVLLIGVSGDDVSAQAIGYGANACVVKPLDPQAFMAKVTAIATTWLEIE